MVPVACVPADEIIPVTNSLGIEKYAIENDGGDTDEAELGRRVDRPRRGQRVIGHDQRDGRQDDQDAEIEARSCDLNVLLAVAQTAGQDADADQAVANVTPPRE